MDGKYAFYTRPQDSFIEAGSGGGIGWGLCDDITRAEVLDERVIEPRAYHTIKEAKNGQGPPPIRTEQRVAAPRARRAQHGGRACATCCTSS